MIMKNLSGNLLTDTDINDLDSLLPRLGKTISKVGFGGSTEYTDRQRDIRVIVTYRGGQMTKVNVYSNMGTADNDLVDTTREKIMSILSR